MDLLLNALGVLAFALLLAVGLLLGAVKLLVWRAKRRMRRLARLMGGPVAPIEIRLVPYGGTVPNDVERLARELEAAGFARVGAFGVATMPESVLVGLTHEAEDVYASVAKHPLRGTHVDLDQSAPDGRWLTITNVKEPGSKRRTPSAIPWRTVVRRPDADVATLMNEFRVARLTGEVNLTPPDRMVRAFEDHYRRFMEYEYTEGRLREIDLAKMTEMAGLETDPKTAAFIRSAQTRRAKARATRAPATILADDPELSKAWATMLDESIAVTDKTSDAELVAILKALGDTPADVADRLRSESDRTPNERFELALAELGWEGRVELVSAMKGAKSIHVYRRTET